MAKKNTKENDVIENVKEEVLEDETKENEDKESIGTETSPETGETKPVHNPILKLRESLSKTQKEFAELLGLSAKDISELENGKSKITFNEMLVKLNEIDYKLSASRCRKAPTSENSLISVSYSTSPNEVLKTGTAAEIASYLSLSENMVLSLVYQNLPRGGMIFYRNEDEKEASLLNMLKINPNKVNYGDLN